MRLSDARGLSAPGTLRTVLASLWSFSANSRRHMGGKHAATITFAWNCLSFFTLAGNFRADYFPALTDGAMKMSWVRNLEKFQGCLCFSSCWVSQRVSLGLSTWKYATQLITVRWRQLKRWLELSLNSLSEIPLVLYTSRVHFTVFLCVNVLQQRINRPSSAALTRTIPSLALSLMMKDHPVLCSFE